MLVQIILFLLLVALVYFASVKKAVNELGGEESAKLGTGVAQMILGIIVFFMIGEDETLLDLKEDMAFLYYLMRYAFLFDGIYGIGQIFIAVIKRIDRIQDAAETASRQNDSEKQAWPVKSADSSGNIPAWQRTQNQQNGVQPQGYVPAWKRIEQEQDVK